MLAKPNAMRFEATAIKNPSKEGIKVISMMSTPRILWFVTKRHKVGLLITVAIVGFTYDNLLPFAARELFSLLFR